jgi:hypothetical protein
MADHDSLAAALVAALADLTVVKTGRTATIPMKDGGKYTYDYADIGDVVKLTRPVLAEHGIVALTPVHDHGTGLACTVTLLHASGERLDLGPFPFPHGRDAQATGSMVTYHRRYALVAALGMAAGDDDDGASAAPRQDPDAAIPGLRTSVQAAIDKYVGDPRDEAKADALLAFFAEHDLPPVKRMNAAQTDVILEHLMSLPLDQTNE